MRNLLSLLCAVPALFAGIILSASDIYNPTRVNINGNPVILDGSTTVYGTVTAPDGPLAGVVVSDGVEVTVTDSAGVYQLASEKELGYVFMSVPGGYEAGSNGVLPLHYQLLKNYSNHIERVDFQLYPKPGQDKFKLFVLGDMHLIDDERDGVRQFSDFTRDLNAVMAAHEGETMYAVTLGDMTWDNYWRRPNNIYFPEYLQIVAEAFPNLQIYHTMGNHDNDWTAANDLDAQRPYTQYVAPTYYSYNIGKIHFIVLDNIDCTEYNGTLKRSYSSTITETQMDWLRKDLEYVDKSTPLIITTHAPIFYPNVKTGFALHNVPERQDNTREFLDIIAGRYVQIATGHSHLVFNTTPDDEVSGGMNIYEHNGGAVCATWWKTDFLTPGIHLSQDGVPGGYEIWDIDGTDISYVFKATGRDEGEQFTTYDLNNVSFSFDDVPDMDRDNETLVKAWSKYVEAFPANSSNEVLVNVWNWNSRWTIRVVDDSGKELPVTQVWTYDPLHILAYSAKQFNRPGLKTVPSNTTKFWHHFFKVTADDADTDLTITVTDDFGNVYTEHMIRPKAFNPQTYGGK